MEKRETNSPVMSLRDWQNKLVEDLSTQHPVSRTNLDELVSILNNNFDENLELTQEDIDIIEVKARAFSEYGGDELIEQIGEYLKTKS